MVFDFGQEIGSLLSAIGIIIATTILFIQNYKQGKNVQEAKSTLTETNGGSTIRDRLDSLDATNKKTDERIGRIEDVLMGRVGRRIRHDDEHE